MLRSIPARLAPRSISRSFLFFVVMFGLLALAMRYAATDLFAVQVGDPDEGVYLGVARLLNHGHVYSEFFFDQFWLFVQVLAGAMRLFGDSLATGRFVVVGFSALGLAASTLLARQLGAGWFALLAIPFGIVNHYYLAQSRITMTDVPGIATMVWALVAAVGFYKTKHRRWLVLCAVAFTASLLIKPLSIGFGVPILYAIVSQRVTRERGHLKLHPVPLVLDGLVFLGVALLVAFPFVDLLDLRGEYERTVGFHWDESSWYVALADLRLNGLVSFVSENRMWLGLCAAGVLAAARRYPGMVMLLVAGEILSALVLIQLPPWRHHYTLLAPFVTTFAAMGIAGGISVCLDLITLLRKRLPSLALSSAGQAGVMRGPVSRFLPEAVLILFVLGAGIWFHDLPQLTNYNQIVLGDRAQDANLVINYLKKHTAPGSYLISDNPIIVYLASCLLPPSAVNLPYESTFRFSTESRERMRESVERYPVQAIVVTAHYKQNSRLMDWIRANFPLEETAGGGGSNVLFARIYTIGDGFTHATPVDPEQDAPPPAPDYIP